MPLGRGGAGQGATAQAGPPHALPPAQDIRLLNAGKPAQKTAEVERDLDKADGMIRLLFNDVQTLKDGRHPQGEQMYRRYLPGGGACPCPPALWGRGLGWPRPLAAPPTSCPGSSAEPSPAAS